MKSARMAFLFYVVLLFSFKLNAAIVPVNVKVSKLNILIESSEFEYKKISSSLYLINNSYYLNSLFFTGDFKKIISQLSSIEKDSALMLDYITGGNGAKIITNMLIAES